MKTSRFSLQINHSLLRIDESRDPFWIVTNCQFIMADISKTRVNNSNVKYFGKATELPCYEGRPH